MQFNNFNNTSVIVESTFFNWNFGDCFLNKFCFYLIFGFPFKVYFFVSVYPTQKMGFLLPLNQIAYVHTDILLNISDVLFEALVERENSLKFSQLCLFLLEYCLLFDEG